MQRPASELVVAEHTKCIPQCLCLPPIPPLKINDLKCIHISFYIIIKSCVCLELWIHFLKITGHGHFGTSNWLGLVSPEKNHFCAMFWSMYTTLFHIIDFETRTANLPVGLMWVKIFICIKFYLKFKDKVWS